jgi:alkylation response protein AidB-like acyl-CoA dehydrogenase
MRQDQLDVRDEMTDRSVRDRLEAAPTSDPLRAAVRSVGARVAERADEIDAAGVLPEDLFAELEDAGVLRCMMPRSFGGLEMSYTDFTELLVDAARADGSLGWVLMTAALSLAITLSRVSAEAAAELTQLSMNPRMRGVYAPKGKAIPVEGGYRVSGRWSFASGGPAPDFLSGHCIVTQDGAPVMVSDGIPQSIFATVPASAASLLDTWQVLGMRGTNSCDFVIEDEFVPHMFAQGIVADGPPPDTALMRIPMRVGFSVVHSALALGLARGAVDDIFELSKTKRATLNPRRGVLSADVVFRHELGMQVVKLKVAASALHKLSDEIWTSGVDGRELSPEEILTYRLTAHRLTEDCAAIVDWAYTQGGSNACFDDSSLQRRLRDIRMCTQHTQCHTEGYRLLGDVLMGDAVSEADLF